MVNLFLDANVFIDICEGRAKNVHLNISQYRPHLSVLSASVICYLYKYKMPDEDFGCILDEYNLVSFDPDIVEKSIYGPTDDFEDNVQLHSAVNAECQYFCTSDKKLLKLGYFGKVKILTPSELPKLNQSAS